jgi:hypothetical protein
VFWWQPLWPPEDDEWVPSGGWVPNDVWPELLVLAVLAYPTAAGYLLLPLTAVYAVAAYTLARPLRATYRMFRVQDAQLKIARGLKHATQRLLRAEGAPIAQLAGYRDGFTATLWRERDAMALREHVRDATKRAIARIRAGETALMFAPECATTEHVPAITRNLAVLASGAIVVATGMSTPTAAIVLAISYRLWQLAALPLLVLVQRAFAVSAAFDDVQITDIRCRHEANDSVRLTVTLAIQARAI